jgi:hypothetical protein
MTRAGEPSAGLRAGIRRARARDPRGFAVRVGLGALLLALLLYLAFGPHPWSEGVAERVREGKPIRPIDYARTWGWWTAAANATLVATFLATVRHWLGMATPEERVELPAPPAPAWFVPLVAAAVAASAVLAWPRLSFSWWDDEEYAVRRYIDGTYVGSPSGEPRFEQLEWRDTFWDDREANNHVPQSALSRLSLAAWRAIERPELAFASERAVRFPVYLAGIASVAMTAVFLRRLGLAAAGVCASWLLALHPWHIRYASEARGYALLLLGVPATWWLLVGALQRGTWRRWLAYGLVQAVLLWTHASMLYQLALTNLVGAAALAQLHRGTPALREQGMRFAVTNLASAGLFAQLMVPNLVQVMRYLEEWQGEAFGGSLREIGAHLLAGVGWRARDARHYVDAEGLAQSCPLGFSLVAGLGAILVAAGAARLLRGGGIRALLVPALLLPGPILYLVSWSRGDRFFTWYLVFTLPGLAALVSAGLTWPSARVKSLRWRTALGTATICGWLGLFAWITSPPRAAVRAGSVVPSRESVLLTRPTLDPSAPENARILTVSFSRPAAYYDPLGRWVDDVDQLRALMAEADAGGLPLYVNWGRPDLAAQRATELVNFVERGGDFEEVATLWGFEKRGKRLVYRYRGATAIPQRGP